MDNMVNAKDDVDEQNHLLREELNRIKETNS
jgi:septal ring factor EnvC (AmiA/AmiB activator)